MNLPYDFWDSIERELTYVLYGDTDSMYINCPSVRIDNSDVNKTIDEATVVANNINDIISEINKTQILSKLGIGENKNKLFFKTEAIMSTILFLDIKKNYVYRQIAKEGKPHDEIKYVGIPVVKSNFPKFTKDLIKSMITDAFTNDLSLIEKNLLSLWKSMHNRMLSDLADFDFSYIGTPTKWNTGSFKIIQHNVIGMRLYNTLVGQNIFQPSVSGLMINIVIQNKQKFNIATEKIRFDSDFYIGDVDLARINYIVVPYNYDKTKVKTIFNNSGITFDENIVWSRLVNGPCVKIKDIIVEQLEKTKNDNV